MAVKFYSDVTRKFYENVEECEKAELELKKKDEEARVKKEAEAAERKKDAHEVEVLLEAASKANKEYKEALTNFCKKYNTYHFSVSEKNIPSLFDWFWNF